MAIAQFDIAPGSMLDLIGGARYPQRPGEPDAAYCDRLALARDGLVRCDFCGNVKEAAWMAERTRTVGNAAEVRMACCAEECERAATGWQQEHVPWVEMVPIVSDPAFLLRSIDEASGAGLDYIGGELLGNRRRAELEIDFGGVKRTGDEIGTWSSVESDADYRNRLIDAVCSCRNGVHVLGRDPATWARCQCGAKPALDTRCPTGAHPKAECDCLVDEAAIAAAAERLGPLLPGGAQQALARPDGFSQTKIDEIKATMLATGKQR